MSIRIGPDGTIIMDDSPHSPTTPVQTQPPTRQVSSQRPTLHPQIVKEWKRMVLTHFILCITDCHTTLCKEYESTGTKINQEKENF